MDCRQHGPLYARILSFLSNFATSPLRKHCKLGKFHACFSHFYILSLVFIFLVLSFLLLLSFWFIIDAPSNQYLFRSSKRLPGPLMWASFKPGTKDSLFRQIPLSIRVQWSLCWQTMVLTCGLSAWLTAPKVLTLKRPGGDSHYQNQISNKRFKERVAHTREMCCQEAVACSPLCNRSADQAPGSAQPPHSCGSYCDPKDGLMRLPKRDYLKARLLSP